MSTGWDNIKPAHTERLHALIMEEFHEYRKEAFPNSTDVILNGIDLGNIIAKAKTQLYKERPEAKNNIPK